MEGAVTKALAGVFAKQKVLSYKNVMEDIFIAIYGTEMRIRFSGKSIF